VTVPNMNKMIVGVTRNPVKKLGGNRTPTDKVFKSAGPQLLGEKG